MHQLQNALLRQMGAPIGAMGTMRMATVQSVDPVGHAAKVKIQPEGTLTGWLPIPALAVGAAAVVAPPSPGDQVIVIPQEGAAQEWHVIARVFDTISPAPTSAATGAPVQSGEVGIFVGSSSYIHLTAAGDAYVAAGRDVHVTAGRNAAVVATGSIAVTSGVSVTVTAPDIALDAATVTGGSGTTSPLATQHFVTQIFANHEHGDVQPGSGTSGPPTVAPDAASLTTQFGAA